MRPGRFDRIVQFPLPDREARVEIFRIHTRGMNIQGEVSFDRLTAETDGISGADIKAICTEAGMFAIREGRNHVVSEDFIQAREKVVEAALEGSAETGTMFA
jgi:proteasome regulatory subunit